MEAKDVLAKYMESCHNRNDYFQYNLASNAVLDWFGRTIKGGSCIQRFLECDVWPQYEQNFVTAVKCNAIESRPTHELAKETPIENAILCTSSETASPSGYESPPPSSRNLSRPPTLHRNKRHKKRIIEYSTASSDSDEGFELDRKSYNLRQNKNVMKQVDRTAEPEGRLLRKRVVKEAKVDDLKDDRSSSPMKRSKKMLDSINDITTASSSAASCPSVHCDLSKPYSELNYFESIGSIRTIRRAKHPNINKVPSSKVITATPLISPESQNGWDRKTKLKISYRTGLVKKDDVQFALIIYEPLTVVTRRNLLEEFQKAAEEEEEQQKDKKPSKTLFSTPLNSTKGSRDSVSLKTPLIRAKPKNEKSSSLRRLRF